MSTDRKPSSDDRHAVEIERLERQLVEEREHAKGLRSNVQELTFRIEILERSYSKQLADARKRAETAETALTEQRARNAELDSAREDAIQLLSDAGDELSQLTKERDQLRRQLSSRDGFVVEGADADDFSGDGGTINALMNDASWMKRKAPAEEARLQAAAEAEARAAEEAEAGEMISPELYLKSAKGKD